VHLAAWLLIDGVLGWIASRVMSSDGEPDATINVALGFAGASLAGRALAHATSNESEFTLAGLFVSFLGAIALLGVANAIRRVAAVERGKL
jgi:uncharacterized membrane protein YeaQ/YmgE (transglycosylase-associated protein family)